MDILVFGTVAVLVVVVTEFGLLAVRASPRVTLAAAPPAHIAPAYVIAIALFIHTPFLVTIALVGIVTAFFVVTITPLCAGTPLFVTAAPLLAPATVALLVALLPTTAYIDYTHLCLVQGLFAVIHHCLINDTLAL